jgi:hypothetical protein
VSVTYSVAGGTAICDVRYTHPLFQAPRDISHMPCFDSILYPTPPRLISATRSTSSS